MATKAKTKRAPRKREVRPGDIDPLYPWERQPDESIKAYAAFEHYLLTPQVERTARGTGKAIGKYWSQICRWSSKYDWVKRARAYDTNETRKRRARVENEIEKMHERQANHAVIGQVASMNTLKQYVRTDTNPTPPKMRDRDAIRLFDVMARVEMRARGEPDTLTETKGQIEVKAEGLDRVAMIKLLEDPEAVEHMAAISKLMGTDGSSKE